MICPCNVNKQNLTPQTGPRIIAFSVVGIWKITCMGLCWHNMQSWIAIICSRQLRWAPMSYPKEFSSLDRLSISRWPTCNTSGSRESLSRGPYTQANLPRGNWAYACQTTCCTPISSWGGCGGSSAHFVLDNMWHELLARRETPLSRAGTHLHLEPDKVSHTLVEALRLAWLSYKGGPNSVSKNHINFRCQKRTQN